MHNIKLTIKELSSHGKGVAVYDNQRVFIPYTLPGEEVTCRLSTNNKKYQQAELLSIDKTSHERVKAACTHYQSCGGCNLQHLNETSYNSFKQKLVIDSLLKAGYAEQNTAHIHFIGPESRRRTTLKVDGSKLGYYQTNTNTILDIKECLVLEPELFNILTPVRNLLKTLSSSIQEVSLTLCDNGIDVLFNANATIDFNQQEDIAIWSAQHPNIIRICWQHQKMVSPIIQHEAPYILVSDYKAYLPIGNFFLQATRNSLKIICDIVSTEVNGYKKILDLYAGCGAYSFSAAKYSKVTAIEGDLNMVHSMHNTLKQLQNVSIKIQQRDLYNNPLSYNELNEYEVTIINPPRNGAGPQILSLAKSKLDKIIMISCSHESFSRDAKILHEHGWKLLNVAGIDQFHWTNHVEIIGVFSSR
jgi:23S rRNA (uracil1939-C5)-methyltransferase